MTGGPISDEAYARTARIRELLRLFQRRSEEAARDHDLTPQRYLILLLVKTRADRGAGIEVAELARRMHLTETTVAEFARRAVIDGLLKATRDSEPLALSLTEDGERRLADATAAAIPLQEQLLHDLTNLTDASSSRP